MARRKVNKAAKIREAFESLGVDARPKDVMATLAARKIKVSSAQVSNIKASLHSGAAKKWAGRSGPRVGDLISLSDLQAAKKLVDAIGNLDRAQSALNALAKLR